MMEVKLTKMKFHMIVIVIYFPLCELSVSKGILLPLFLFLNISSAEREIVERKLEQEPDEKLMRKIEKKTERPMRTF